MISPPASDATVSVTDSEYSDVYEMLIQDLELYMEMFMPVEVSRRMAYYLVAKGHTGLAQFLRGLGPPPSPATATGSRDSLRLEQEDTDIGR